MLLSPPPVGAIRLARDAILLSLVAKEINEMDRRREDWSAYLGKAHSSYRGAEACLDRQAFDSCINRCYYAVFQGAIAALIRLTDFRPQGGEWSHKATQAEFNRRLVIRRKVFAGEIGRTLLVLME